MIFGDLDFNCPELFNAFSVIFSRYSSQCV